MRLILFAALLASAAPARADSPFLAVNNNVSLSYVLSNLYYIEPGNINGGTYDDYEKGDLNGARLAVSLMRHWDVDNVYVHAEFTGAQAKVDYTGYYLGGPPYRAADGQSMATTQDFDFKLGKGFALGSRWMLTPYLSFGRRYWKRELGIGTSGDYIESYTFFYHSIGSMVQFSPIDRLVLTGDASIGRTDNPMITVGNPAVGIDDAGLGQTLIKKAAVEADYRLTGFVHLFAGVDYTLFNFGQSAIQPSGYYEPFSRTQLYDYTAGVRLSFSSWHPLGTF